MIARTLSFLEDVGNWFIENIGLLLVVSIIVWAFVMLTFAVINDPQMGNHLDECLERGYTRSYRVSQDGGWVIYCSRMEGEQVIKLRDENDSR